MSAREEFDAIVAEYNENETQYEIIRRKSSELSKKRDAAFKKLLVEEKILGNKTWKLNVDSSGFARLTCAVKSSDWPELACYAESNYHCSFDLGETPSPMYRRDTLSFNDGTIDIRVNDLDHLKSIIEKYSLKVEFSEHCARSIQQMEKALEVFKPWKDAIYK